MADLWFLSDLPIKWKLHNEQTNEKNTLQSTKVQTTFNNQLKSHPTKKQKSKPNSSINLSSNHHQHQHWRLPFFRKCHTTKCIWSTINTHLNKTKPNQIWFMLHTKNRAIARTSCYPFTNAMTQFNDSILVLSDATVMLYIFFGNRGGLHIQTTHSSRFWSELFYSFTFLLLRFNDKGKEDISC